MASQKLRCLILLILLIERNPKRPFTFLTAVIDTYILNTDSLRGKDRREDSKSLAWSSVKLAFRAVLEMEKDGKICIVERPKALGDIRGVSYIYALFYRFGLIQVPEKFRTKMD